MNKYKKQINLSFLFKLIIPIFFITLAIFIKLNSQNFINLMTIEPKLMGQPIKPDAFMNYAVVVLFFISLPFLICSIVSRIFSTKSIVAYTVSIALYTIFTILLIVAFLTSKSGDAIILTISFSIIGSLILIFDIIHIKHMVCTL